MSDLQQQADAIYGRPTVIVPLADYDRLRGIEERAQALRDRCSRPRSSGVLHKLDAAREILGEFE